MESNKRKEKPKALPTFLPFFSDYGFKVTFGNEADTLFLRTALQALTGRETPILSVQLDKHTIDGYTIQSRAGIYDLVCSDAEGDVFIVEMQLQFFEYFIQRMKYYAYHRFDSLIRKGNQNFTDIPRLYAISILNFKLFRNERYVSVATLT